MTVLRTSRDGCWEIKSNHWGRYLAPTVDPDADTVITKEQLEGFELNENITRIPADLWNRWIELCFEMVKRGTGDLEVSCRLLRNDAGEYRIVVPVQKVTGVSVRVDSFDKAIDITDGQLVEQWPPEGWLPAGSSHSHNTMDSFFSGTDDKYELGDPGLHIVVGNIDVVQRSYTVKASVTANFRRFMIDDLNVIELDEHDVDTTYHPNVLNAIELPKKVSRTQQSLPTIEYRPVAATRDFTSLTTEMEAVRQAANDLILAATTKAVPYDDALSELAMELDGLAFYSVRPMSTFNEDPFYWNDNNVF